MSNAVPRVRLFAGPNGSGKSVLKSFLPSALLGVYVNPDEIESQLISDGFFDLGGIGLSSEAEESHSFFRNSELIKGAGSSGLPRYFDGKLDFRHIRVNSYHASVMAAFLRRKLLEQRRNFTFESVMSHESKVRLLSEAQAAGYRTYLYYVATDDPLINISRVSNRVALGGHSVPEEKIISRYHRSLALLMDAIQVSNRAYVFDNSTDNADGVHTWLAEITEGGLLELKTDLVPSWFKKAVLEKIAGWD